jgi:hypothetical protein
MSECKFRQADGCGLAVLFLFVWLSSCTTLTRLGNIEKKIDKLEESNGRQAAERPAGADQGDVEVDAR